VIIAVGDKGKFAAVRRPLQAAILAVIEEQFLRCAFAVERHRPHLMLGNVSELTTRRDLR